LLEVEVFVLLLLLMLLLLFLLRDAWACALLLHSKASCSATRSKRRR
jgi:hypothetical protein